MADRTVDAFRAFYDRALPDVYGYLRARLFDAGRVEAVTRAVFWDIVRQWPLPATAQYEMAWCLGVARHKLIEELRRQERAARRRRRAGPLEGPLGLQRTLDPAQRLQAELASLPANQRGALILRHIDRLTVEEVADVLGKGVRATEALIARGSRRLGSELFEAADG